MTSKAKRNTRSQREPAIHIDASADETIESGSNGSAINNSSSNHLSSRQDEKNHLSHLNDRLAGYIERVRSLETENARLQVQINDVEVDFLTRERAKLQIGTDKAQSGYEELKSRVGKLEKDLKKAERERNLAQADVQDITARYNNADAARANAERENEQLKHDLADFENNVEMLRQQLEDESVLRTELENRQHTLKDDLEFARRSHNNQIEEIRRKRQIEMTSFNDEVEHRYQAKLQEQLQSIRDDFDNRIALNRAEVDELYRNKLGEAAENANRNRDLAAHAREEASMLRVRFKELENASKDHHGIVESLNRRVKDLEAALRRAHDDADLRIQQRDEQIAQLQKEIALMISDYQDLLDVKVQLDMELQAYQKLLEQEETRLNITPSASPNTSTAGQNITASNVIASPRPMSPRLSTPVTQSQSLTTVRRGTKRRRLNQDDYVSTYDNTSKSWKSTGNANGDLEIGEVDKDGQYITLRNKGTEDIAIGGWQLKSVASAKEVTFKLHSRTVIKAGKMVTIWSSNSGQEHQPPSNLVMKLQQWPQGDAIRTELLNSDREVEAWTEAFLQQSSAQTEEGSDADKNCRVM
uniref:Lamin n=1 Tax=Globodera rostochiensis TaxID=31243 RepID=A0A914HSS4_GLORO